MLRWPNLTQLLSGMPWAIVGAVATRRYMPERATRDLDIAVLAGDLSAVEQRLSAAGFLREGALTIGVSSWTSPEGTAVDVLEGREPWWPEALALAAGNQDDQGAPVLTAPYLVLTKLLAGRVQDIADVSRIVGEASDDLLQAIRGTVREHAGYLSDDLESLIILGRLEHEGS